MVGKHNGIFECTSVGIIKLEWKINKKEYRGHEYQQYNNFCSLNRKLTFVTLIEYTYKYRLHLATQKTLFKS